jgi:hypothetical protein
MSRAGEAMLPVKAIATLLDLVEAISIHVCFGRFSAIAQQLVL